MSYKGGVGKSTIAQNLLVYFALNGISTALIDADNNQSSVSWYGVRPEDKALPGCTVVGITDKNSIVKSVNDLSKNYQNVIIDCPPVDSPITTRALLAADICLVPIAPSGGGDLWATQKLFEHVAAMRASVGRNIPVYVFLNRYRENVNLHLDYVEALKEHEGPYGVEFLEFKIRERIAFGYANVEGLGVLEFTDPKAREEINILAEKVLSLDTSKE